MTLRSTDIGAPVLNGIAGSLITVLDACLVNGYNSRTLTSITRSGATATATFNGHGYAADGLSKIQISGANETEYNGTFSIFNVGLNTFDFTVTGTPATTASGTITSIVAPLGWGKAFSGTNLAAYRSNEGTSTRLYLRVDDTTDSGKSAGLRGYETMTDVSIGTGLFPTTLQMATGTVVTKALTNNATSRPWYIVGDGFEFYLFNSHILTADGATLPDIYQLHHFGDMDSEMASDPYGCCLIGPTALEASSPGALGGFAFAAVSSTLTAQAGHYFARSYTQTGGAVTAGKNASPLGGAAIGLSGLLTYPQPHNNGLYIAPIFINDTLVVRGQLKGIYQPLHVRPLGHNTLLAAAASPINHRLLAIGTTSSAATTTASRGEVHVDIDGPWR